MDYLDPGEPVPLDHRPKPSSRYAFSPAGMYPFEIEVTDVGGGKVRFAQAYGDRLGLPQSMPADSFALFVNDLRGFVLGPPSGDPFVDAVLSGEAELLGKGNDGIAFRVGPAVVKVSTTVPYQPLNPGHLTPAQAVARMKEQHRQSERMRAAGVPGILPTELIVHGGRAFLLRKYIDIPKRLTPAQLEQVKESVYTAHELGYVFRDELQVGVHEGVVYHYDTGPAGPSTTTSNTRSYDSDEAVDISNLKRLYRDHGAKLLTPDQEKLLDELDDLLFDPPNLPPGDAARLMLQYIVRIDAFTREHPSLAAQYYLDERRSELADLQKHYRSMK